MPKANLLHGKMTSNGCATYHSMLVQPTSLTNDSISNLWSLLIICGDNTCPHFFILLASSSACLPVSPFPRQLVYLFTRLLKYVISISLTAISPYLCPHTRSLTSLSIFIVVSVTESSESSECSEISEVSEQISEGDLQSANPTMMPSGEWWGEKATMGICSSTRNTIFTLAVQYSTNHEGLENHEVPHASREYPVLANASKVYNSPRLRYNHFGLSVGSQPIVRAECKSNSFEYAEAMPIDGGAPVATAPYKTVIQTSIMCLRG